MSDHDRGAYTPQTDEPLAFDARRPSERRPVPMTLIGSAVVLVLLIGGVALVYRGGVRGKDEAPRPVGQPVMAVKTAPVLGAETTHTTTTTTASTDATVSTDSKPEPVTLAPNQTGASPTFAAAPEQPAARPKPSPSTVAMMAPHAPAPVVAPHPVPARPESTRLDPSLVEAAGMTRASDPSGGIKLAQASKIRHGVTSTVSEEDEATPAPNKTLAAKSETAKPKTAKIETAKPEMAESGTLRSATSTSTGPAGGSVVQIGAFSSTTLADTGYADVSKALAGRMGGKSKHVMAVTTDGGKTLFRTWVSGFSTRADAVSFCEALKAKNKLCIVKG